MMQEIRTSTARAAEEFPPPRYRPHEREPWDMRASGIAVEDAPPSAVVSAVESGVCARRIPELPRNARDSLQSMGLARGGVLTNAAALLFCSTAAPLIACRCYDSPEKTLVDAADFAGPLLAALQGACVFVARNIGLAFGSSSRRVSLLPFLSAALPEIVLNALVHRDYRSILAVKVVVRPGLVEVSNPGCFPSSGLRLARTPREYAQAALEEGGPGRNALLVQALYRFGVLDAAGAGLAHAAGACALCGLDIRFENVGRCAVVSVVRRRRRHV